jgi:hypothetical protein
VHGADTGFAQARERGWAEAQLGDVHGGTGLEDVVADELDLPDG